MSIPPDKNDMIVWLARQCMEQIGCHEDVNHPCNPDGCLRCWINRAGEEARKLEVDGDVDGQT